ncbi:MAG: pilus assembly protein [Planctomycetes bacterium]|jgi:Flp pilus assembly protein TadG|nr:pilus assembly protein [Planctomycetota bacterium]
MVEAAFVLPLLLLTILGMIEYGWLLYNIRQVTNAARQGARITILPHGTAENEAATKINRLLTNAKLPGDLVGPPTFTYEAIPGDPEGWRRVTVRSQASTANLHIVNMNASPPAGIELEPPIIGAKVTMALEGT